MRRILWGRATSSNVMKAIWTLEELQLPYERIDVGGAFGKTDTSDYRAMNPTGLVPPSRKTTSPCGRATRSAATCATPMPRTRPSGHRSRRRGPTSTAGWTRSRRC